MKAVLFDLDGVITSERVYWNCSGLAIARYAGEEIPKTLEGKVALAQEKVPDALIRKFKEQGINSNWDITYAVSVLKDLGRNASWFVEELKRRRLFGLDYLKLLDELDPSVKHDREGGPWEKAHREFQQCYYELEDTDETVIDLKDIKRSLKSLKGMGLRLGIVTGRPYEEAKKPLVGWGLWEFFDPHMIVTENEVEEESKRAGHHLGKPHPYPLLRAIFAHRGMDNSLGEIEKSKKEEIPDDYVFVGDSTSDVLAAKNAKIPVICVRTGIASEKSLKDAGADHIVDDVADVPKIIKDMLKSRLGKRSNE